MKTSKEINYESVDTSYLILYPIVFCISWIWIDIARTLTGLNPNGWMEYIDLPLTALNGFLNAIVHGYI